MIKMKFEIANQDDEIRIDKWFYRHYPELPFSLIAKLVRKGEIRIDGKRIKISTHVKNGQQLVILGKALAKIIASKMFTPQIENANKTRFLSKLSDNFIKKIQKQILFQNDELVVINKPIGIATQGGTKVNISVDEISDKILAHVNLSETNDTDFCNKPDTDNGREVYTMTSNNNKLKIVHRLDKETSGALILARSSNSAAKISKAIREGLFKKTYIAILSNIPNINEGIIDFKIAHKRNNSKEIEYKSAITKYRVLDCGDTICLVEFEPLTGRTHQLRIHSSMLGCPILGDRKYNTLNSNLYKNFANAYTTKNKISSNETHANARLKHQTLNKLDHTTANFVKNTNLLHLHAWKISLILNDMNIEVRAPIPEHFYRTAKKLHLENMLLQKDTNV